MANVTNIVKGIIAQQFEMPAQEVGNFVVVGNTSHGAIVNTISI